MLHIPMRCLISNVREVEHLKALLGMGVQGTELL